MPAPPLSQFRRRAVELAPRKTAPVAPVTKELGVSESCLRNWVAGADIDEGRGERPDSGGARS